MAFLRRLAWRLAPLDEADLLRSAEERRELDDERRELEARVRNVRARSRWIEAKAKVLGRVA